jgi:hypothetical protein
MKKLLLLALLFIGFTANAQLLKKIKEKAQQAIEPKKTNEAPATNNQGASSTNKPKEKWVPTADCEKLFTLEKGETFLYDETKVTAVNGKISYAFIVINSKYEYYVVEDGKRTGPFKEPPLNQLQLKAERADASESNDEKIELGGDKKDPVAMQYSKTINNKLFLVFNGKNYGPYDFVAKMIVSPDKKKFWAAVTIGGATDMLAKMGMGKTYLVNEAAVKQTTGDENSFPAKLMVSDNFSAAALTILDNSGQKAVTISSAGKKQEGSINEVYSGKQSSMTVANNGDIISIPAQSPTQLMVNGEEAASFKIPVTSLNRLFIMPDYKKSVFYQAGKLYRGDGSEESLTGVVFPKFVPLGNEHAVYYYKISEQDNGDKDVYLCKKIL